MFRDKKVMVAIIAAGLMVGLFFLLFRQQQLLGEQLSEQEQTAVALATAGTAEALGGTEQAAESTAFAVRVTAAVRGTAFDYDGVNTNVDNGVVNLSNNQSGQSTNLGAGEQGSVTGGGNAPTGGEDKKEQQSNTDSSAGPTEPGTPPPPSAPGSIRINWTYP